MKQKFLVAVALLLFTSFALAGDPLLEPTQSTDSPYRLFNTQNMYTLLKLDTRSGRIWQVQWGDKEHRTTTVLNEKELVLNGKPGRFTLYPTKNIYTFILLDQELGTTWHVQWGNQTEQFLEPIN